MGRKRQTRRTAQRPAHSLAFRLATVAGALLLLLLLDVTLRSVDLVPREDPLLFHMRTYVRGFSPWVETGDGRLRIRPDWEKTDEIYRVSEGGREGRLILLPGFRPCEISRRKPPGTIRIFALGGSTTFGQWVGAQQAFPALLGQRLREAIPDRQIEVINLGCPGLESTRVAILHEAVLALEPDLIVVYSGHNEMLAGEELIAPASSLPDHVRATLLRRSALASWINYGATRYRNARDYEILTEEAAALEAGKILSSAGNGTGRRQRLLSDEFRRRVAAEYERNVSAMAVSCDRLGVPTLFVVPPSNPLFAPERSAHRSTFAEEREFDTLLERSQRAFDAGRLDEALEQVERAIERSPEFAMARFVRGVALMESGRTTEADVELQAAIDLDVAARRATSSLQSALLHAVDRSGCERIDLRPLFQFDTSRAKAKRLFVDHCHPTAYGHQRIADAIFPVAVEMLERRVPAPNRERERDRR